MMHFKILSLLALLIVFTTIPESQVETKSTYAKKMDCRSDKKLALILACSLTPVRRNVMTVNFRARIINAISPDLIRFAHFTKEDGEYKLSTTYGDVSYNFCEAMEGNIPHRVRSFVIKLLQIVAPSAVRKCPYQDFMEVRNVTINLTPVPIIGGASENLVNITITRGKFLFLGLSVYYGHSLK